MKTARLGWILFVLALTIAPYIYLYFHAPTGTHYTWILPPYPEDSYAYFAWSRQAYDGKLLFSLKFSGQEQGHLFNPFFLACGWLSRLTGLELGLAHLVMKSAGVLLFFFVLLKLCQESKFDRFETNVALLFAGVASGFGALWAALFGGLFGARPADLWLIDSNTFWCLLWNPLYPYSLALLACAVVFTLRAVRLAKPGLLYGAGLAVSLSALIHPYCAALMAAFAAAIVSWRWRRNASAPLARLAAAAAPGLLYIACLPFLDAGLRQHAVLGQMKSPGLLDLALGFGFPLLAVLLAAVLRPKALKRPAPLLLWFALCVAASRLPVWFQSKLLFGAHIPLCLLAAVAVAELGGSSLRKLGAVRTLLLGAAFVPFLSATHWRHYGILLNKAAGSDYFVDNGLLQAVDRLRGISRPEDLVFSSAKTSRLVAAFAGNTVLWGHWAQALNMTTLGGWLYEVFDPKFREGADRRARRFWASGARYALIDSPLRRWLIARNQDWLSRNSKLVFENSSAAIYECVDCGRREDLFIGPAVGTFSMEPELWNSLYGR